MYEFTTICEIFSNLSLFFKLNFVKIEFSMVLEFMELEYHEKILIFFDVTRVHKIEFQKSSRLLNIYQTVVDYKIFSKKVVFGHFGHSLAEIGGRRFNCIKKKENS